ncbi:hypothetical protein ED733_008626 [Metarhizium rileyi]|uniref:Uncharacterized protein n=1 Tax=Metarhizium rileyi (strain RCEF 4871) TaxID=1649241 RepID=A0A5C6GNK2_METRR|nr:hypothetical protein ED733_008626 [Metarhizium rileyi]
MLWELSMVTGVVSNLTGLMTGGMYVLLRSSKMGKLGPKGYYEFESQRSARRPNSSVPHSFIFTRQMEQPVPLPTQLSPAKGPTRSIHTTQDVELGLEPTDEFASGEPRMAGSVPGESVIGVATTTPVVIPSQEPTRPRKNSAYSLFSRETSTFDANSASLLPATAYTPSNKDQLPNPFDDDPFLSPPTIRFSGRRTRELSFGSSATVPIGIRVSNINDMAPIQSFYEVPPFPRAVCSDGTVSGVPVPPVPDTLAVPDETAAKEAKDKQLPPVPLSLMKEGQSVKMADEEVRLSPTVYTPPQRTPRKGRDKVTSPTSPSPGPRHNSEGYPPVDEAEWI